MKKFSFLMVASIIVSSCLMAQQVPTKINEIGFTFSNLNNYGISYKHGNGTTFLRLTGLSLSFNKSNMQNPKSDTLFYSTNNQGFGFSIGFEKRKPVSDKLGFYYGVDLLASYFYSKYNDKRSNYYYNGVQSNWSVTPGLGIVLGVYYKASDRFSVSAEIVPSVRYSFGKSTEMDGGVENNYTQKALNVGLSNSGANVTIAYRL